MNNVIEDTHYSRLDNAIATFLADRYTGAQESQHAFKAIVKDLSASLAKGHSCIKVSVDQQRMLKDSGLVSKTENTPLIQEGSRLYLHRYWQYETRLAQQLRYKVNNPPEQTGNLKDLLEHYFSEKEHKKNGGDKVDWQRMAAEKVALQLFSIITGGPGTGKTTAILKILALLQELQELQEINQSRLTIALAAPTGKAAMRLQESIGKGKQDLKCADEIKQAIPDEVSTIHRLLGAKPASPYFRHHADNPLVYDLVVIDEASMVDLALMGKLVDALKPDARLILLGDKDQLASVESGAILSDLSKGLSDNTSELKKSWRFDDQIKALAHAINQQDKQKAWELLESEQYPSLSLVTDSLMAHIMSASGEYFRAVKDYQSPEAVFKAYQCFQVLCSNRRGKLGVEGINSGIEYRLQRQGIEGGVDSTQPWYLGKPIIITRNDPSTQLFNGDIGICLAEEGGVFVYFQLADGTIKKLLPSRLPQYETAYALTIHKSQGSEFDHVLMVLPEKPNPVLGKELVYTAVTRAKKKVEVASSQQVFDYALSQQVERHSGLRAKVTFP